MRANDMMAIALCDALQAGGISVPGDVAGTGYDGTEPRSAGDDGQRLRAAGRAAGGGKPAETAGHAKIV